MPRRDSAATRGELDVRRRGAGPPTGISPFVPARGLSWPAAGWIQPLSRADWLTRDRILAWCGILLTLEVLSFCFLALLQHGVFFPMDPPTTTDFVSFYAAGKLAVVGTPALAYNRLAHAAAEAAATMPGIQYRFFFYPPTFLLLCAPLALLPYLVSFAMFEALTFVAWLLVMRRILAVPGWAWSIPLLAYPAVFWTLGLGQNSFLTAALLGGATLLLSERPIAAGVLLGAMCYKPHLALLAPFALAAGGRWRTFAAAAVTVAAAAGLSGAIFGVDTWRDYLAAAGDLSGVYETGLLDLASYVTPFGGARLLGAGIVDARWLQGAVSAVVVLATGWIWWRDPGPEVRSAALAAGILLSVPVAIVYDLLLLTVAIAWLVRAGRRTGFLPWEKLALFGCFVVPLLSRHLGEATHIPIGPLAPACLLALCVSRTWRVEGVVRVAHAADVVRVARAAEVVRVAHAAGVVRVAHARPDAGGARPGGDAAPTRQALRLPHMRWASCVSRARWASCVSRARWASCVSRARRALP
jgi:hypothetical protein